MGLSACTVCVRVHACMRVSMRVRACECVPVRMCASVHMCICARVHASCTQHDSMRRRALTSWLRARHATRDTRHAQEGHPVKTRAARLPRRMITRHGPNTAGGLRASIWHVAACIRANSSPVTDESWRLAWGSCDSEGITTCVFGVLGERSACGHIQRCILQSGLTLFSLRL